MIIQLSVCICMETKWLSLCNNISEIEHLKNCPKGNPMAAVWYSKDRYSAFNYYPW